MTTFPLRYFLFVCIFYLANHSVVAQGTINFEAEEKSEVLAASPYHLSLKKDLGIFSGALGLQIAGLAVANNVKPLTLSEIELLSPASISNFDRNTIRHFSAKAHTTSDYLLYGSMAFPIALMADKRMRKDLLKIGTMASEAFMLNAGLTLITKGTAQRVRPYAYNPLVSVEDKMAKTTKMSFFSGHTSAVSVLSFFSAKVYADYYPNSKWKPVVWSAAAVIPAATGYLRYRAGKHFPTDVIVGYGVGAAIGVLIPHLHKNKKVRKFILSPMATGEAIGFNLRGVF
ncbi:MAG: phosphatase PAP2 family protein [Bacteroidota bacterium]